MSYVRIFLSLVLCSVFVIGCVTVDDGVSDDIDTSESAIVEDRFDMSSASSTAAEMSRATVDSTESEATAQSCYRAWDCQRCPNNTWRNVYVEYCDDGSERIISAGPCNQPCF